MRKENVRAWGWFIALLYTIFMLTFGDVNNPKPKAPELTQTQIETQERFEKLKFRAELIRLTDEEGNEIPFLDAENKDNSYHDFIFLDEGEMITLYADYNITKYDPRVKVYMSDLNWDEENLYITSESRNLVIDQVEVLEVENGLIRYSFGLFINPKGYGMEEYVHFKLLARDGSIEHRPTRGEGDLKWVDLEHGVLMTPQSSLNAGVPQEEWVEYTSDFKFNRENLPYPWDDMSERNAE